MLHIRPQKRKPGSDDSDSGRARCKSLRGIGDEAMLAIAVAAVGSQSIGGWRSIFLVSDIQIVGNISEY